MMMLLGDFGAPAWACSRRTSASERPAIDKAPTFKKSRRATPSQKERLRPKNVNIGKLLFIRTTNAAGRPTGEGNQRNALSTFDA
jgi:hypothetical protein